MIFRVLVPFWGDRLEDAKEVEAFDASEAAEQFGEQNFGGRGDYFHDLDVEVVDMLGGRTSWTVEVEQVPSFHARPRSARRP